MNITSEFALMNISTRPFVWSSLGELELETFIEATTAFEPGDDDDEVSSFVANTKARLACGHFARLTREVTEPCRYWSEGVASVGVAAFGLLGNLVSVWVLTAPEMRNAFNRLLMALAVVDCLFILPAVVIYTSKAFSWTSEWYNYAFPVFLHPFSEIALCSSINLTVAVAVERYIGLCRPFRRLSERPARAKAYVIPAMALALVLNMPKFFESETVAVSNATQATRVRATELRMDPNYITYYWMWTRLLATGLVPLIVLIVLNALIYASIRSSKRQLSVLAVRSPTPAAVAVTALVDEINVITPSRQTMRQRPPALSRAQSTTTAMVSAGGDKLAPVLFGVVVVFVFCNVLRIALNIYDFHVVDDIIRCQKQGVMRLPPAWVNCSISVSHLMLVINSSVNFLVYCVAGSRFRHVLRRKLRRLFGAGNAREDTRRGMRTQIPQQESGRERRLFN